MTIASRLRAAASVAVASSKAAAAATVSPQGVAALCLIFGITLAVAGVYILAGLGWAMIAGAVPLLLLSGVLIRGLINAG